METQRARAELGSETGGEPGARLPRARSQTMGATLPTRNSAIICFLLALPSTTLQSDAHRLLPHTHMTHTTTYGRSAVSHPTPPYPMNTTGAPQRFNVSARCAHTCYIGTTTQHELDYDQPILHFVFEGASLAPDTATKAV